MRYIQNVKIVFAIFSERAHKYERTYKRLVSKTWHKGYISKLGTTTPNTSKIKLIADYFGVSVDYLMTGEESQSGYYLNEDTAKLAQEMYEDPDMRSLFDMKRKMPADRFSAHVKFMKELYEKENPSDC